MSLLSIFSGTNQRGKGRSGRTSQPNGSGRERAKTAIEMENVASLTAEAHFHRMLWRERRRSERSGKQELLMEIGGTTLIDAKDETEMLQHVAECLSASVRETDIAGWLKTKSVFGVLFTELGDAGIQVATNAIRAKMAARLQRFFIASQTKNIRVSFYPFPDGWEGNAYGQERAGSPVLRPSLFDRRKEMMRVENFGPR